MDYWREVVRLTGPEKAQLRIKIFEWNKEADLLRAGLQAALDAEPCHVRFNSVMPAKRAVAELNRLEKSDAENQ